MSSASEGVDFAGSRAAGAKTTRHKNIYTNNRAFTIEIWRRFAKGQRQPLQ
jgi:hypothetical protein